MWRKTVPTSGGALAACAVLFFIPSPHSIAQSLSFDERWPAIDTSQKTDRAEPPKAGFDARLYFFDLPTMRTTVVVKTVRSPAATEPDWADSVERPGSTLIKVVPARDLPNNMKRKEKLPVGCESSFSPVTTPAMANVSGRCLS